MDSTRTRERIIEIIAEMRKHTTERGCTSAEAAAFAAKAAHWIEKYQIEEAELRAKSGAATEPNAGEVCHNTLRTGKRVFNPGMTQVVNGLALGMCCKVILLHQDGEAVYGIVGDELDADYVCQISVTVVPTLTVMAKLEGAEHGYEKAGLVRWTNQYLTGAAVEIQRRIEQERKDRSDCKKTEWLGTTYGTNNALAVITGESLAVAKRQATDEAFAEMYPRTRKSRSRTEYNHAAHNAGCEAGKRVGLNIAIGE